MGVADIRETTSSTAKSEVDRELAADIAKLNTEWREKRDSLRSKKKNEECATLGPIAAADASVAGATLQTFDRRDLQMCDASSLPGDNGLAEAAGSGRLEDCRRILTYTRPNVWASDGTTPLCAASLWDQPDVVRLLLEAAADPNQPNGRGLRPTALHAAALQENGKICMLLLSAKADPHAKDGSGVSPNDYASCSEAVWPHFAATGCNRVSKEDLVSKGVIRKASSALELELEASQADGGSVAAGGTGPSITGILPEFSRPGSAYVLTSKHPPRPGSALSGNRPGSRSGSRNGRRASGAPIDILAEGDEAAADGAISIGTTTAGRPRTGYAGGVPPLPPSNTAASKSAAAPGSMRSLGL